MSVKERLIGYEMKLCDFEVGNVYAQAGKIEHFTEEELIKYRVDILDDGAKVSDDVIKEILCHPFPMQPQKEFTYHKDLHDNISLKSDEGHNMQFGG